MKPFTFSPLAKKQWQRFKSIRRGYWSLILLSLTIVFSLFAELLVNSRAIVVMHEGELFFPTYGAVIPGDTFGLEYAYETNYRELRQHYRDSGSNNWLIMPLVPYNPLETNFLDTGFPPYAPTIEHSHYLGTDSSGRDVAARIVYGFRIARSFSLLLLIFNYLIGVSVGSLMGFWGGTFDLIFQRLIEIWSNVPFLYIVMILASIITPGFWTLVFIMILFGWMSMTWYMRTATYKEKAREYVTASRALGASNSRIIFRHILPNTLSIIITFVPFSVAGGITALTALDYLGFGLPPPTPSWGELLNQGIQNLESPWIVSSVIAGMTFILVMVAFIGEAVREAFDPRKFTTYE